MSLAIVDVREWQNVLDLRTGKKRDDDTAIVRKVRQVLGRHPYPGDTDGRSNTWVTDTALDLLEQYEPQLVFLSYVQQYFSTRFLPLTEVERQNMYDEVFREVERFVRESGFAAIIVGTGDMMTTSGSIDLSRLDGLALTSHWATRHAGIYNLSEQDRRYVESLPEIEKLVSQDEFLAEFGGSEADRARLPDFILSAREGYYFKTPSLRQPVRIPAHSTQIPLSLPDGFAAAAITDIGDNCLRLLERGKTAIILVEGVGLKDFRLPCSPCANHSGRYCYEPGESQYLALTQGRHQVFTYPPGYWYRLEENESREYPFSGYFTTIPEDTLGRRFPGRSMAVGNRSMFMHTLTGADIAIECFARNLNNQGAMAVIHPTVKA